MDFIKKLFGKHSTEEVSPAAIHLPFEFITTKGADAVGQLTELRNNTNITPIIMGNPKELDLLIENLELAEESVESILAAASDIQFPHWFEERAAADQEYYQLPHGDWPEDSAAESALSAHRNVLTRKPLKEVVIGKVPTSVSWEVPAHLKLGGWNECPLPHEHVAIFKKWAEEYGAKVACVTSDVIEFTVEHPPTTREHALKLAEGQFLYCSDIVYQGVETIANLAAGLMNSKVWYFCWD